MAEDLEIKPPPSKASIHIAEHVEIGSHWLEWFNSLKRIFNNLVTNLVASRLVQTDANKNLASVTDFTNWVASTDGHLTVTDDGDGSITVDLEDVWEDMRVDLSTQRTPAANAPNWAQINDDGAAGVGIFAYHFDDGEYIFLSTQFSHKYKQGSTIYPHIHFICKSDVDPSDNFGMELEYQWLNIGDDQPANTTTISEDIATGVNTLEKHQIGDLTGGVGIDGTGKNISSVFTARLKRVAAGSDNYAAQIAIISFDIHFEADTMGSRQATSK